jgi:hypothetical protein
MPRPDGGSSSARTDRPHAARPPPSPATPSPASSSPPQPDAASARSAPRRPPAAKSVTFAKSDSASTLSEEGEGHASPQLRRLSSYEVLEGLGSLADEHDHIPARGDRRLVEGSDAGSADERDHRSGEKEEGCPSSLLYCCGGAPAFGPTATAAGGPPGYEAASSDDEAETRRRRGKKTRRPA